ncbi:unnamed protein product [Rotaria socialis]|uniref:Uncharacterized protein n=1 Tax=Rotaria socialis TaxID=392032 RepID=A0A820TAD6_9BILA|nr:unnamed protein product [Rotaria socialis]
MKKSKEAPVIVETSVGKFLLREFRPPIQLRTSPRKEKTKLKKEIKRLDENSSSSLKSIKKRIKKRQIKIKKQLSFNNNDEDSDKNSILFIISNNEQENTLNDEELTNTKCSLCFVNSKTRRALIFSPRSSRLTLLGLFSLMQISGPPACLHGFNLEPLKSYFVFNLSSQSLMSIEIASSSSKTSMHENQILSFFNDYRIELPLPEIYIEFIQRLTKFHHGLSVFFVEQFETTWIESMKQFSNSNLSNQWLFHNDDDNDEEQIENTDGFKQLWPGMGAFKHSYPLIDCINHIEILKFEKIGVGLLHRQIESKYLLQVLNGSIIALCRVKHDMLYFASNAFPALIDERANVECLGFGFIRSIDMTRHEIHVIIPDRSISKTMINALVKGYDDCPDEFYFMSIDRWRGHMPPYVTGIFNSIN